MKYMETGSNDPYFNLAFEEYVLLNMSGDDIVMLWQNDKTVVIGRNQNAYAEINRDFTEKNGINTVRRSSGGGAVYHDLGNINYSFITKESRAGGDISSDFKTFTVPVAAALCTLGLDAEVSGRNDILVKGKKVSGTAQRHAGGRLLHHGTLLFDSDLETAAKALNADAEKLSSKGIKSVRSRITNIRACLNEIGKDMTVDEFFRYIKNSLCHEISESQKLSQNEILAVEKIKREKYALWEWNFGCSWEADITREKRFPGGKVCLCVRIDHGRIEKISFYGDFLSRVPVEELCQRLCGCVFDKKSLAEKLEGMDIGEYFGEISMNELLELFY